MEVGFSLGCLIMFNQTFLHLVLAFQLRGRGNSLRVHHHCLSMHHSPGLHSQHVATPVHPSSSAVTKGTVTGAKVEKPKAVSGWWRFTDSFLRLYAIYPCILLLMLTLYWKCRARQYLVPFRWKLPSVLLQVLVEDLKFLVLRILLVHLLPMNRLKEHHMTH